MKELTHEEWMENPTPRTMWVWDNDEDCKEKMKVVHFSEQDTVYPIVALADNDLDLCRYRHCAEIGKQRRMTNKELSRWLRLNPTREFKYRKTSIKVRCEYVYYEFGSNVEVEPGLVIRENDGEWKEPLVEVEER